MILDLQTTFSGATAADGTKTGQAITATAISTNVLDLRNFATGITTPVLADEGILGFMEMWLIVSVLTAAAGGDAAKTLTTALVSDSTVNLATSPTTHIVTTAVVGSTLIAGYTIIRQQLPSGDYERYLGMSYTVSAGFTAFEVLAYLTPDPQRNLAYPSRFTVA